MSKYVTSSTAANFVRAFIALTEEIAAHLEAHGHRSPISDSYAKEMVLPVVTPAVLHYGEKAVTQGIVFNPLTKEVRLVEIGPKGEVLSTEIDMLPFEAVANIASQLMSNEDRAALIDELEALGK